jgi:glutathione-specific gamma-glutamylcyclotransferase
MERAVFFPSPPAQSSLISTKHLSNIGGSSVRAESHHLSDIGGKQDPFICLVYIGLPSNPQFLGPQQPEALAKWILGSKGPSGENREYLYELYAALDELGPGSGDRHVSNLVDKCRRFEIWY